MFNNHIRPLENELPWLEKCRYWAPGSRQSHLSHSSRGIRSSSRSDRRSVRPHCSGLFTNTLLNSAHMALCRQHGHTELISSSHSPQSTEHSPLLTPPVYIHYWQKFQLKFLFTFTGFDTVRVSLPAAINKHINRTFMSQGVPHMDEQSAKRIKLKGRVFKWPLLQFHRTNTSILTT